MTGNEDLTVQFGEDPPWDDLPHGYTDSLIAEVPIALFIMSLAKLAEDKAEWFPLGKWATIQAIEDRIEKEIATLFVKLKEGNNG